MVVLIPPWGHHPCWCPGALSSAFSSPEGTGSVQHCGCSSPSPPGWAPASCGSATSPHLASSGKGMLSCAPVSSPREGAGNQPWCPLPALPSGAAHALSGPAHGSAGCSTHQTGPPFPGRPADSPNNGAADKNPKNPHLPFPVCAHGAPSASLVLGGGWGLQELRWGCQEFGACQDLG